MNTYMNKRIRKNVARLTEEWTQQKKRERFLERWMEFGEAGGYDGPRGGGRSSEHDLTISYEDTVDDENADDTWRRRTRIKERKETTRLKHYRMASAMKITLRKKHREKNAGEAWPMIQNRLQKSS